MVITGGTVSYRLHFGINTVACRRSFFFFVTVISAHGDLDFHFSFFQVTILSKCRLLKKRAELWRNINGKPKGVRVLVVSSERGSCKQQLLNTVEASAEKKEDFLPHGQVLLVL